MRTEYKEGDLLTKEDIGLVFKDKEGYEVKIIHFSDSPLSVHQVIGISKDNIHLDFFNLNGSAKNRGCAYLVSFVGPNFTEEKKQPRIFTYEGYLNEFNINKGGNLKNFKCKITVEEIIDEK